MLNGSMRIVTHLWITRLLSVLSVFLVLENVLEVAERLHQWNDVELLVDTCLQDLLYFIVRVGGAALDLRELACRNDCVELALEHNETSLQMEMCPPTR